MHSTTRSEFTANIELRPVTRFEPRAVEHHRPTSNGATWAVLVVLGGASAGLLVGLAVGLLNRYL